MRNELNRFKKEHNIFLQIRQSSLDNCSRLQPSCLPGADQWVLSKSGFNIQNTTDTNIPILFKYVSHSEKCLIYKNSNFSNMQVGTITWNYISLKKFSGGWPWPWGVFFNFQPEGIGVLFTPCITIFFLSPLNIWCNLSSKFFMSF